MNQTPKASLKDVAKQAGVSTATVSLILRGSPNKSFRKDTVMRVEAAARALDYQLPQRTPPARKLIAIFKPTGTDGNYYAQIEQAIDRAAQVEGYDTLSVNTYRNAQKEERLIRDLSGIGIAGMAFTYVPLNIQLVERLSRKLPVVVVNNSRRPLQLDTIQKDNRYAGELMMRHILSLGHEQVAFLSISRKWQGVSVSYRQLGAEETFQALCPQGKLHVISESAPDLLDLNARDTYMSVGMRLAARCLDQTPATAMVTLTDYMAYGVLKTLAERNMRVPEDMSVCSCDGIPFSAQPNVDLTTVDRHPQEAGFCVFETLLRRIRIMERRVPAARHTSQSVVRVEFMSEVVIGKTTAPPGNRAK